MKKISFVVFLLVSALALTSCGAALPQAAVDAANAAFQAAKDAKADAYAPDSYKMAADANDALQANLSAKAYDQTAALAKALTEAAEKATTESAAGLDAAKKDVATLQTEIAALAGTVKIELAKVVKAGKKAKLDMVAAQTAVMDAETSVAEAKTAADSGDFASAKIKLAAAKDNYSAQQKALEAAGYLK